MIQIIAKAGTPHNRIRDDKQISTPFCEGAQITVITQEEIISCYNLGYKEFRLIYVSVD